MGVGVGVDIVSVGVNIILVGVDDAGIGVDAAGVGVDDAGIGVDILSVDVIGLTGVGVFRGSSLSIWFNDPLLLNVPDTVSVIGPSILLFSFGHSLTVLSVSASAYSR